MSTHQEERERSKKIGDVVLSALLIAAAIMVGITVVGALHQLGIVS